MTIHPKKRRDLLLAPVAAAIDHNLQRLRGGSARQVAAELELEFDTLAMTIDRDARELVVLRQALRDVDLHGWRAAISDDGCRLHLSGGSVALDLGLSSGVANYIREGVRLHGATLAA
ncbi:MAG: hypothetical protein ACRDL5_14565 [Solirubrobacteraceae bacterium]